MRSRRSHTTMMARTLWSPHHSLPSCQAWQAAQISAMRSRRGFCREGRHEIGQLAPSLVGPAAARPGLAGPSAAQACAPSAPRSPSSPPSTSAAPLPEGVRLLLPARQAATSRSCSLVWAGQEELHNALLVQQLQHADPLEGIGAGQVRDPLRPGRQAADQCGRGPRDRQLQGLWIGRLREHGELAVGLTPGLHPVHQPHTAGFRHARPQRLFHDPCECPFLSLVGPGHPLVEGVQHAVRRELREPRLDHHLELRVQLLVAQSRRPGLARSAE
mmetsp:Transcript_67410/g.186821  ORF Transcript_67410/g.186821 Transcript_67410/m.186821 type:complete len:273 (-) Transcript_67410:857-1675(-)